MPVFRRLGTGDAGGSNNAVVPAAGAGAADGSRSAPMARQAESQYAELKTRVHRQLIDRLDLDKLATIPAEVVRTEIARVVQGLIDEEGTPLSRQERERLVLEIWHETFGLGPLEILMQDPTISDILVNGPRSVYVERRGKLERTDT